MSSHIIGHVDNVTGTVSASRADGTRVELAEGDAVFEGDEVHTGADSAVAIVFIDDTTFSLGANASMALDEMIFDPDSQSGSSAFSILEGAFVFVSGQIAEDNPDNMTVGTPVATIGVRGTEVGGNCGEGCVIALIDGKIVLSNAGGPVVLSLPNMASLIADFNTTPGEPFLLTPDEFEALLGRSLVRLLESLAEIEPEAGESGFAGLGQGGTFRADGEIGGQTVFIANFGNLLTIEVVADSAEDALELVSNVIGGFIDGGPSLAAVNEAPAAVDDPQGDGAQLIADALTTDEDTILVIPSAVLTANDIDPDGDPLQVVAVVPLVGFLGTLTLDGGTVTYDQDGLFDDLAAGETATVSFQYTVSDGQGGSDTAIVEVTITGVNDAPVIANAGLALVEGGTQSLTGFLVASDVDTDSAAFTYQLTAAPEHGMLVLAGAPGVAIISFTQAQLDAGEVLYVHDDSKNTSDSFSVTVSDGQGGFDTAIVAVTVELNQTVTVGYYDMALGAGNPDQEAPILAAGHAAVSLADLTAADLVGIDVLVVQNDFSGYGAEYLASLAAIEAAVANGMVLVFNDSFVGNEDQSVDARTILPGGEDLDATAFRELTGAERLEFVLESGDIDVANSDTVLTDGLGGEIDNDTLDGGNVLADGDVSSVGYVDLDSLPEGAVVLLTREDPEQVVAFSYSFGEGDVVYSTIPLDLYLAGSGQNPDVIAAFAEIYGVNVVQYGASLFLENLGLQGAPGGNGLTANAGADDTIVWDPNDADIDGGPGTDTLKAAGGDVDLAGFAGSFTGIEVIDLEDGAANVLTLGLDDILGSDTNTLTVIGDVGDRLVADFSHNDVSVVGGGATTTYVIDGAATLIVDNDIDQSVIFNTAMY